MGSCEVGPEVNWGGMQGSMHMHMPIRHNCQYWANMQSKLAIVSVTATCGVCCTG